MRKIIRCQVNNYFSSRELITSRELFRSVESRFAEFERQQLLGQGFALRHEQQLAGTAGTGGTTAGVLVGIVVRVATVGTS
jgi:hypothetical protein